MSVKNVPFFLSLPPLKSQERPCCVSAARATVFESVCTLKGVYVSTPVHFSTKKKAETNETKIIFY